MAKNELISLALISNGSAHAYGMNMILNNMQMDTLAKVSKASIYNTLIRLEADYCIAVSNERIGNMPERKVYTITKKGIARLKEEFEAMLSNFSTEDSPMHLAGIFAFGLKTEDVILLIEQRVENLNTSIKEHLKKLKWYEEKNYLPLVISTKATVQHQKIEIKTAKDFIELLRKDPEYYERLGQNLYKCMIKEENL